MTEITSVLDGKVFVGEFGKIDRKAEGKDELVFQDGKFHSTCCESYGFGDTHYTVAVSGDTTTFAAETFSTREGRIKWSGIIKDEVLDGTFTWHRLGKWYRVNKAPIEYWFKGQLKT